MDDYQGSVGASGGARAATVGTCAKSLYSDWAGSRSAAASCRRLASLLCLIDYMKSVLAHVCIDAQGHMDTGGWETCA